MAKSATMEVMRAIAAGCACAMLAACGRLGFDEIAALDGAGPVDAMADARLPLDGDAPTLDAPLRTIEFVQAADDTFGSLASGVLPFNLDVTAGNTVVLAVDFDSTSAPTLDSVTDDRGTAFAITGPFDGSGLRQYIAYGHLEVGGPDTVLVTAGGTHSVFEVRLHEYAGIAVGGFDGAASAAGSSMAIDDARSAPVVAPVAGELIFGVLVCFNECIAGTEFATRSSAFEDVSEDRLAPAPGSYEATGTLTVGPGWLSTVAAFRPAPL